jgi:hypothetical protein
MNKKIFLSVLFVLAGVMLRAQNITTENLVWHVSYIDDVNTGERTQSENEKLVTFGSDRIEWRNANGSIKHSYTINNVGGSWSNVSNNGSIVYQFTDGDQLGTVTFERIKNEIMVRVLLGKDDALPEIYEIKIVKITTL